MPNKNRSSSQNSTKKNKATKAIWAIALSIFVHGLFVLGTFLYPKIFPASETAPIDIALDEINENQLEYLKTQPDPRKIVEFDKKEEDKNVNEKAKYLSAKNNTVKKETIAKLSNEFKNVENKKEQAPTPPVAEVKHDWTKEIDKSPKSKMFDTGFDVYSAMKDKKHPQQKRIDKALESGSASSATDRIDDAEQTLMTQLNTKEYKYYGYYSRIRQQLNQWWQPKVKEKVTKLMARGRTIAASENKNTRVIIVLNDLGSLVKVQILGASGVRELDDAAVEAFRQAAPFPNPPKGLVDADGTIKIRWDFIVES